MLLNYFYKLFYKIQYLCILVNFESSRHFPMMILFLLTLSESWWTNITEENTGLDFSWHLIQAELV